MNGFLLLHVLSQTLPCVLNQGFMVFGGVFIFELAPQLKLYTSRCLYLKIIPLCIYSDKGNFTP